MRAISLILCALAAAVAVQATAAPSRPGKLRQAVSYHRAQAWKYADMIGQRRHPTRFSERKAKGPYLHWLVKTWRHRHVQLRRRAHQVPNYSFWMCVHSKEATWTDTGSPYWGGLQMGTWFMRTYGWNLLQRKGTADNWTPLEQIWVAERAWQREGYSVSWLYGQWPNTAPPCR